MEAVGKGGGGWGGGVHGADPPHRKRVDGGDHQRHGRPHPETDPFEDEKTPDQKKGGKVRADEVAGVISLWVLKGCKAGKPC